MATADLLIGDALTTLRKFDDEVFDCCITSPPYYNLRNYKVEGQLGQEKTPEEFIYNLLEVLMEVYRVLKPHGTLWLNLGDSYANKQYGTVKHKDLVGVPWTMAFALRSSGWFLRQDIIWHKPNPMPESIKDRCTKAHEYLFLLSKNQKYYYDYDAILEPSVNPKATAKRYESGFGGKKNVELLETGQQHTRPIGNKKLHYKNLQDKGQPVNSFHLSRLEGREYMSPVRNKRSVWTVTTKPFKEAHFATFPPDLIEPCVLAGCPEGGTILDPFNGAGTTGLVALKHNRNYLGIDLNPEYIEITRRRLGL